MLHDQMMEAEVAKVRDLEQRADLYVERFRLAAYPRHVAVWTVLAATIATIEDQYARFGPHSSEFRAAMINLGRHCPMLIRWLTKNAECQAPSSWRPVWEPSLGVLARADLDVVNNYDAFQCSYPMWYRNRVHAKLLDSSSVRFTVDGGARERQVSAYQKGLRPLQGIFKATPGQSIEPTIGMMKRYQRVLEGASLTDPYGFCYEHPYEIARRTKKKYSARLASILRRSETVVLGNYSLGLFKEFYAALQAICAMHDYLCFCWTKWQHPYPLSSSVLVWPRETWVKELAYLAGINKQTTDGIIADLTFYSKRLPDLHVFPFVPLSNTHDLLALIPQFVLGSNPEENILRTCSYLRPQVFNQLSNEKEESMRNVLLEDLKRYQPQHSIELPNGSTEIDLVVEDEASSTVLISELKWYRKPSTYRERLRADEHFLDGLNRQLRQIRQFCREHPGFLKERKKLKRDLNNYEHVYFALIARDHWIWAEPSDDTFVIEFEQFRDSTKRHQDLCSALSELIKYEWLPKEGVDFHVRFDSAIVEAVRVESEVFYAGPSSVGGGTQA